MAVFGIDLGTTYSCVARVNASGDAEIIRNEIGEETTPSVVFFESAQKVRVGREAKNAARTDADLVVTRIKQKMGDPEVRLEFHGMTYTPESISALILKHLARVTEQASGMPVKEVIITVPAYFGIAERQATRLAGDIAGLTVVNVVPEPVAAALHYQTLTPGTERTILVYDLGGGTFDTTVIRLANDEVTVVCTDGNHKLGGVLWDDKIASYFLDYFMQEHPDSGAADSEDFLQDLAIAAEEVKKALTRLQTHRHTMRFAGKTVRAELSRGTFEDLTSDLLQQTMDITDRTLRTAREKGVGQVDEVLLVGGSTHMPAVAAALAKHVGATPKRQDPDLAVAKGAARFALHEAARLRLPGGGDTRSRAATAQAAVEAGVPRETLENARDTTITTVVPRAFGVLAFGEEDGAPADAESGVLVAKISHLLHANTPLPTPVYKRQFYTASDNQREIEIEIWEQAGSIESDNPSHNNRIGQGTIRRLPPLPMGSPVDISFQMDEGGRLQVEAVELRTGQFQKLTIEVQIGELTKQEVTEARNAVARLS